MVKAKAEKNTSNRRQAFRIYEQVDLVFHKIEFDSDQLNNSHFNNILNSTVQSFNSENAIATPNAAVESALPASYSQKNETLNVNISSTGIAFTTQEELVAGDYLMLRVLLLSSMIVMTTCCKVVYVKPSNPFENNQHPYTVGVRFIKLKAEDKGLLDRHVKKKRVRQLIIYGIMACLCFVFIQVPDLIFELIVDILSFIVDESIEIFHLLYEMIEYGLDQVIEHTFHTDIQTTQTIVFYLQSILTVVLLIPVFRGAASFGKRVLSHSQLFLYRKKSSMLYYWGEQTVLYKIGMVCLVLLLVSVFGLCLI